MMHGVVDYPRKCAGGRLRKMVSTNNSKCPFCPDDCVLYRFVAFRLSVAVGMFHTSGFPCLSLYTLRRVARALPPIHRLQWEDSLLRVNFMPIHGQRMWRASPKKGELRFWRCNKSLGSARETAIDLPSGMLMLCMRINAWFIKSW